MNTINIDLVKELCIANRNWLHLPTDEIGTYNIDQSQVNKIYTQLDKSKASKSDIDDAKKIIKKLIESIEYINYNQYIEQLKKITSELINKMKEDYDNIYFIAEGDIDKSNTWVMMLFIDELLNRNFFDNNPDINKKINVSSDIFNLYKYLKENVPTKKILFIFFDDMSYSGRQIELSLPNNKGEKNIPNFNIYLCMGYIGKTAIKTISENSNFKIFPSTKIIDTLYNRFLENNNDNDEYIKLYKKAIDNESKFYSSLQLYDNLSLIYFDHKIADVLSICQKLIYFGSYPLLSDGDSCMTIPLIKKCEEKNLKYAEGNNFCSKILLDISDENSCPVTYYKQHKYIDKNKNIITNIMNLKDSTKNKYLKYKMKYLKLKKDFLNY